MWRNPTSLAECETALDNGKLYVPVGGGKFWLARRNGATKRYPSRFRVPIKYGFRETGTIEYSVHFMLLRIANSREEAESDRQADGMGIGKSEVVYSERTEHGITAYVEK